MDIPKPSHTDRTPVPAATRRADTSPIPVASPRATETVAAKRSRDHLPVPQPPATATRREPDAPASDASIPSGRLGQYELIRQIGRGGMGTVYLARDLRLGRLVAIKLLARLGSHDSARFLAEARVTAHTGVAKDGRELRKVARQALGLHAHRAAGCGAKRGHAGLVVLEGSAGDSAAAPRVAQYERPLVAQCAAVQTARDWHEVAVAAEHKRGLMGRGEVDRAEGALDGRDISPPEQPRKEAP